MSELADNVLVELTRFARDGIITCGGPDVMHIVSTKTGRRIPALRLILSELHRAQRIACLPLPHGNGYSEIRILEETQIPGIHVSPAAPSHDDIPPPIPPDPNPATQTIATDTTAIVETASIAAIIPPTSQQSQIALFIDADNAKLRAEAAGYNLSFNQLREYCRQFGRVVFAYVFISMKSRLQESVQALWQAGFVVILCPLALKDKDAVDAKMKDEVRKIAEFSLIDTIVVVSEDKDLTDDPILVHSYVRDLGKKIIFISPTEARQYLEGDDVIIAPRFVSTQGQIYREALEYIVDYGVPRNGDGQECIRFALDVVRAIGAATAIENLSFNPLREAVWSRLARVWSRIHGSTEVTYVLEALKQLGALRDYRGRSFRYYTLDSTSPLMRRIA
ncbi:MAG: NYN domain-containing protein [Patescibacteria group bacterium]